MFDFTVWFWTFKTATGFWFETVVADGGVGVCTAGVGVSTTTGIGVCTTEAGITKGKVEFCTLGPLDTTDVEEIDELEVEIDELETEIGGLEAGTGDEEVELFFSSIKISLLCLICLSTSTLGPSDVLVVFVLVPWLEAPLLTTWFEVLEEFFTYKGCIGSKGLTFSRGSVCKTVISVILTS